MKREAYTMFFFYYNIYKMRIKKYRTYMNTFYDTYVWYNINTTQYLTIYLFLRDRDCGRVREVSLRSYCRAAFVRRVFGNRVTIFAACVIYTVVVHTRRLAANAFLHAQEKIRALQTEWLSARHCRWSCATHKRSTAEVSNITNHW